MEDCFWTLEDRKVIVVHLEKVSMAAIPMGGLDNLYIVYSKMTWNGGVGLSQLTQKSTPRKCSLRTPR